jgi:uncharacterized protein
MLDNVIKVLEKNILAVGLGDDSAGHDIYHFKRVTHHSKVIAQNEPALFTDEIVLICSAMLHDIHRTAFNDKQYHPPYDSLPFVSEIIERSTLSITESQKKAIFECIERHEEYNVAAMKTNELAILQDADNLDALGIVGFVRAVQFGTNIGEPFYSHGSDINLTTRELLEGLSYSSIIDHIYGKILRLNEFFNTHTAKEMAIPMISEIKRLAENCESAWLYG